MHPESGTLQPATRDTLGTKVGFRQLDQLARGNPGSTHLRSKREGPILVRESAFAASQAPSRPSGARLPFRPRAPFAWQSLYQIPAPSASCTLRGRRILFILSDPQGEQRVPPQGSRAEGLAVVATAGTEGLLGGEAKVNEGNNVPQYNWEATSRMRADFPCSDLLGGL